jgi:radical SAM superfamily enzyme YgiQ (UPF0313 family)
MKQKSIYVAQFGTGTNINLLPLGAGQLYSRLRQEKELCEKFSLREIEYGRPADPEAWARSLDDVGVIGFSAFMWTVNISLLGARAVKDRFPDALVAVGGPSIPKDLDYYVDFMNENQYIDVICVDEGEELFVSLCQHYADGNTDYSDIPGLIYRDQNGEVCRTAPELLSLDTLPSPFLDGTFDDLWNKYGDEFSGIIWETNRGCPYDCTFCTWANLPTKKIREKPMDQVAEEIEWIGKHSIGYIAMCDANFGIQRRDLEIAKMLADCKQKYGVPNFISVSWAKNSTGPVLEVARVLKKAGIGFRVTLSIQSASKEVTKAIKRSNVKREAFDRIKAEYRNEQMYSYTEIILGLPRETKESFLDGIDTNLTDSVFDQLYMYPCFLFPNTEMATIRDREAFGIEGKLIPNRYTKSKEYIANEEVVEIVIGTNAMPREAWVETFTLGYYTLALHDDRLAFFILNYLKNAFSVTYTDLIAFARDLAQIEDLPTIKESMWRLEDTARRVQDLGHSHLIDAQPFDVPYDPPDGAFLELALKKTAFYREFLVVVEKYLESKNQTFDRSVLADLFAFQNAVMAHPDSPPDNGYLALEYNWFEYFASSFGGGSYELIASDGRYKVVDPRPSFGDPNAYLTNHFDIRGIPPFNEVFDLNGEKVFPKFGATPVGAHVSLTNKKLVRPESEETQV